MTITHIIGGGLAGLNAALHLAEQGVSVSLYEASPQLGGRCRSYFDAQLGCEIDNGNHLLLRCNREAHAFIAAIGAEAQWQWAEPRYLMRDALYPRQWEWAAPYWLPHLPLFQYWHLLKLPFAKSVSRAIPPESPLGKRWAVPLCVSALNTPPDQAEARQFLRFLIHIATGGRMAAQARIARAPFQQALLDPAMTKLKTLGVSLYFSQRLQKVAMEDHHIRALHFASGTQVIAPDDRVIFAVPPREAQRLLPELSVPKDMESIVNLHFRYSHHQPLGKIEGIIGSVAEWVFFKADNIVSTTTSAANHLQSEDKDELAKAIWRDLAALYGFEKNIPPYRAVNEKLAGFTATRTNARRRPSTRSAYANLYLAGDYTQTGYPATIEGALRSGRLAADACLASR